MAFSCMPCGSFETGRKVFLHRGFMELLCVGLSSKARSCRARPMQKMSSFLASAERPRRLLVFQDCCCSTTFKLLLPTGHLLPYSLEEAMIPNR